MILLFYNCSIISVSSISSFIIIIFIRMVNFYIMISVVEIHGIIYIIEKFIYESK